MTQTTTNIAVRVRKEREGSVRNNLQGLVSWDSYLPATFLFLKIEGKAPAARPYAREAVTEEVSKDAVAVRRTEKKAKLWK